MKVDMLMPQMGESIAEATISKWLKRPGDSVKKDEVILEISTDKVDSEIPAPATGVLSEVLFKEGDVVPVKTKIALIDTDASGGSAAPSNGAKAPTKTAPATVSSPAPTPPPAKAANASAQPQAKSDRYYSPLVRSLADKHGINESELATIRGSGSGGRVSKDDILQFLDSRGGGGGSSSHQESVPTPAPAQPAARPAPVTNWDGDDVKVVPMDTMRQAIADHMVRSKHTSPHVYSIQEVDMTAVSKWRARFKGEFEKNEGFKLSFTPFFLEAAVQGLVQFPQINASVDGKKIILKKHVNLGCAVALGTQGLIVPVIKNAEERNFVGLARGLNDLANRARTKKLLPDDVQGGTFTVTNPGVFGTIIGTPIINQPQVAILCLGAIKKRPVVVDDMIAIREMCYLTLSYDHRIIDGSMAGQYLAFLSQYLEGWDMNRKLR